MASRSKIEVILSAKDSGLSAALKRGQAELRVFGAQVQSATAPVRGLVSAAFSLKTALAGLVSVAGVTALSASLLKAGTELGQLRLAFGAISGSSQNAAKEMEFVRTTADKLGLDLQTAAQAYKGISAAAQGTSLAGKNTQAIFTSVAKASTVLGLSADETSGALLAISQMISKGKVSAEELRGQLGERLPGAFQIAAQAMGVTTAELDKMLQNGEIFSDVFLPKFAAALETRFGGAALGASKSFTAASNRITTELFNLKAALGEVVTNNTFFVEAMGKVSGFLKTQSADVTTNAASWRQWAKESALAVLQFVADSASGFNETYKSLSWLSGSLKMAYAGSLLLGQGFQFLFEQSNRLTGDTAKAEYWARAQADASLMIEQAMAGAAQSFDNAEQGSKTLDTISSRLSALRKELEAVKAGEVNPVEGVAKQAEIEFKEVEGRWIGVQKTVQDTSAKTTKQVSLDWGRVYEDFEGRGLSAADAVDSALDRMARDREVKLTIREVQAHATGGIIQRFARGGRLPGYGGGDRISALLEAGEFVIRKEAVSKFGAGIFHALNSMKMPEIPRFAIGGPVGFATGGQVLGGEAMTINLNFGPGRSVPVQAAAVDAVRLKKEFARMDRLRSA